MDCNLNKSWNGQVFLGIKKKWNDRQTKRIGVEFFRTFFHNLNSNYKGSQQEILLKFQIRE